MRTDTRKYLLLASVAVVVGGFLVTAEYLEQRKRRGPRDTLGENYSASVGEGSGLIGTRPTKWTVTGWINSAPLSLDSLRGNVVLVRWWTAGNCPYCQASAPALNEFWQRYRDHRLVVIGVYHHKSSEELTREHVEAATRKFGFKFPVAVDEGWDTLKDWWLAGDERRWTSVTFLLDREGIIRHIHPGGAFFRGESGYDALEHMIEELLAEK